MDAGTDLIAIHDDVAEFALLLTRLKERTDRPYAALARRLDMNASTLHRYCAGEAVPLEFSGIERFAALCGASRGVAPPVDPGSRRTATVPLI
ncbi:helix-turn-helix domain-containing protein [Streptomyces kaempferi]|uniref:Helix-turn-helix domain-containing protein n=1 Tax=Streptomyces kaempferi TaxID=333725 RepID=A0ABW3XQ11_9ACTN